MASPLPPPPLNGPAIKRRNFFAASLTPWGPSGISIRQSYNPPAPICEYSRLSQYYNYTV